jgi:hypothetical protein
MTGLLLIGAILSVAVFGIALLSTLKNLLDIAFTPSIESNADVTQDNEIGKSARPTEPSA